MRIFYLLPSLKLTNFLVVETPMLPPNACDRSQQVVGCSQIRKSRAVIGCADFQQVTSFLFIIVFCLQHYNALKPCFWKCKNIAFGMQNLCFYLSKPKLLHNETYAFTSQNLSFCITKPMLFKFELPFLSK